LQNADTNTMTLPASLSRSDAVRFLQRATFGGTPNEVDTLVGGGVDAWFTQQFAAQPAERYVDRLARLDTPNATVGFTNVYWHGAFTGADQLRKRVAYALSQIFVVSEREVERLDVAHYADVLEANAFGTFRNLLEVITYSRAMGRYLTYNNNRKANPAQGRVPDENYAREIMQLFTIGLWQLNTDGTQRLAAGQPIATYGLEDVRGLARIFTGLAANNTPPSPDRNRLPMAINENNHEVGASTFLGVTVPANTTTAPAIALALDALVAHPNTGPFVCKQLIQRLVTSNPTPAYVARVAAVFANDGSGQRGNLAAMVRAILVDDEAWQAAPPSTFGKLREPVLRFTTVMRALGVSTTAAAWPLGRTNEEATSLGQSPFYSPSVFNFYRPGYVPPQTALGTQGLAAPEFQIATETSTLAWVNFLGSHLRSLPGALTLDLAALNALAATPAALVDEIAARLCPDGLSSAVNQVVVRRVGAITRPQLADQTRERVLGATLMIAASTDFLHER
jgi:uncharacterized protein (DUF1800 family)